MGKVIETQTDEASAGPMGLSAEQLDMLYRGEYPTAFGYWNAALTYSLVPDAGGGLRGVLGRVPGAVVTFTTSPLATEETFVEDAVDALKEAGVIRLPRRPRGADLDSLHRHVGRAVQRWHAAGHAGLPPVGAVKVPGYHPSEVQCVLTALADELGEGDREADRAEGV
jgi:hypothetical protein